MALRNGQAVKDNGRKKGCVCCERDFIYTNANQKYCESCRSKTPGQRELMRFRLGLSAKAPASLYYIECVRCGKAVERTNHNQRYCPECQKEVSALKNAHKLYETQRKPKRVPPPVVTPAGRKQAEEAVLLNYHDLSGKSADRISAEALAFGFGSSYGKYVACVQSGMIDRYLSDKGIKDPVAVLRSIKTK